MSPAEPTGRARGFSRALALLCCLAHLCASTQPAWAAGVPITIFENTDIDSSTAKRIKVVLADRRSVRALRPLPTKTQSPEELANQERVRAIALALKRAEKHEEFAKWDACAKEAGDKLGDATELLATSGKLDLLRDLHVQIGVCMSLIPQPDNAKPHFRTAVLLDETPPQKGLHREEAERAHSEARDEVLKRIRGPIRIETVPAGAEVWLDGRKISGRSPIDVKVRLGSHFLTLRRFRFESQTNHTLLHPGAKIRLVLSSARTATLRQQLSEVGTGTRKVPIDELRAARSLWSKAPQLVLLSKPIGPAASVRISLIDANTTKELKSVVVPVSADDESLRSAVCGLLGEQCEPPGGIPWYVWPIAGAAAIGAGVTIGFMVDAARDSQFCPRTGCN